MKGKFISSPFGNVVKSLHAVNMIKLYFLSCEYSLLLTQAFIVSGK